MSKIIKSGNSLAITIPSSFIKQTGLKLGDEVTVNQQPASGQLTIILKNIRQLPLIK